MTERPAAEDPRGGLRRELGLLDAAAITAGNILGSGIFVAPAAVAAAAPGLGSAALWILGGLIAACGAFCYAECGARLPRTGGFYVFYRAVYGEAVAFVGGWASVLVTYPASIAAIALVSGQYLQDVLPGRVPSPMVSAAIAVGIVVTINFVGVRLAAGVQKALTAAKIAALAALCLAAVFAAGGWRAAEPHAAGPVAWQDGDGARPATDAAAGPEAPPAGGGPLPWSILLTAVVVMLWTYDGWSDFSLLAGEVRDAGRVLGRAVALGMTILVALYVSVQASVAALLPPDRAAASGRVVAEAVEAAFGAGSARLVALLVVLTTFGSVHGVVLASSRVGFAMARDRAFFGWFGSVHPRFGTPARSVTLIGAATLVYVVAAPFRDLLGFFSFSVWIFYGLTAAALLVLRRRQVGGDAVWRAPGGPLAPVIVLLTAAGMTSSLMAQNPRNALAGLAMLLAGFPVFVLWRRLRGPAGS